MDDETRLRDIIDRAAEAIDSITQDDVDWLLGLHWTEGRSLRRAILTARAILAEAGLTDARGPTSARNPRA